MTKKSLTIDIYQVDAFSDEVFSGNPAAVCPLDTWLDDKTLLAIAEENNLSETAFFVKRNNKFLLRWFTPVAEVDLCGHATLAAAHIIFDCFNYAQDTVTFETLSGELIVTKTNHGYSMDFPSAMPLETSTPSILLDALGISSAEVLSAYDYMVVIDSEARLRQLSPNFLLLQDVDLRGVIVTAPGDEVDFVSRCFFPKLRINEDPVTGSAHCELTPYWANRLRKNRLTAKQLSSRGGEVICELQGNRTILSGQAITYLQGSISI